MEVIFIILLIVLKFVAPVVIVIGLIWLFFVGRRVHREKKSLNASKGDEAAMAMEKDRIKVLFINIIGVILWPVVFVAVISMDVDFVIALAAASICSGIFGMWARSIKKRYNVSFKENIVKAELSKVFDNLTYEPSGRFGRDSIQSLDFFASVDDVYGNDLIDASYKGVHFTQCDLGVQQRYMVTVEDKDGFSSEEERWRDVFKGRAMRLDFAAKFRGRVQVVTKDFEGAKVKYFHAHGEWQAVETELAEFGKYFGVYARDPLDAMAVLTPQMIEGIFYLKKALDVPTAFYFIENTMIVFMALSREAFDISGKYTLLEERELLKRDIALVTGFLEVMYFKPQESAGSITISPVAEAKVDRVETAAVVAAAAGPSESEKLARSAKRTVRTALSFLPIAIVVVFLVSAVYGVVNLPDNLVAGASYSGGEWSASSSAMRIPTAGYLVFAGVFIIIGAFQNAIASLILLAIHLLFMSVNL